MQRIDGLASLHANEDFARATSCGIENHSHRQIQVRCRWPDICPCAWGCRAEIKNVTIIPRLAIWRAAGVEPTNLTEAGDVANWQGSINKELANQSVAETIKYLESLRS